MDITSWGITAKDIALGSAFTAIGIIATFLALFLSPSVGEFVARRRERKLSKRRDSEWRMYRLVKDFRTGKKDRYVNYLTLATMSIIAAVLSSTVMVDEHIAREAHPSIVHSLVGGAIALFGYLLAGALLYAISDTERRYRDFDQYQRRVEEKFGLPVDDEPTEVSGSAPPQRLIEGKAPRERQKLQRKGA